MKKSIFLLLFTTFLFAQNPNIYSVLGNVIYDNVLKIQKLKTIKKYLRYEDKIDEYILDVQDAKEMGFAIDAGDTTKSKTQYLKKIRSLSKTNDYFQRNIFKTYKASIKDENSELFSQIINSDLFDSDRNKDKIMQYYFAHCDDINTSGVIQKYLDEDEEFRKQQAKSRTMIFTKKEIQEAKIRRIRLRDKEKQEEIQKKLQEELIQKKKDIRKEQVQELAK
ncbi:hypothetical protein [Sulfurimonas sp.]|uniref:hypothetical protein n=1 Tax=Sulfurimonas sp. TaxID=2022749 RepID=UPI002B47D461|nr:hypothetical protein [Sulfurimonas sp.]